MMEHKGVLFVAGVAVGSLCGLLVGSVIAGGLGNAIRKLGRGLSRRIFHEDQAVKFELLLQ